MKKIFRYEVPVDDKIHKLSLPPKLEILSVAAKSILPPKGSLSALSYRGPKYAVEFWGEVITGLDLHPRYFVVFGTGHAIPDDYEYKGTCPRIDGFIWHLYETP